MSNSVYPDETAHYEPSHLDLRCLPKPIIIAYQGRAKSSVTNLFVCVEVLRPSQPNGVMSSAVILPNHTFTGQA